eukprot:TRINITY_DN4410_c0_g1_i3.p1 TRINITY_DN4410_c0_g1~~TRINITY_DN4410_c0_g1_i3.p1  ORF type:complete len:142 (+),score=31.08 TRINITY_DN4410_c0_g1_i3:128-553(+)
MEDVERRKKNIVEDKHVTDIISSSEERTSSTEIVPDYASPKPIFNFGESSTTVTNDTTHCPTKSTSPITSVTCTTPTEASESCLLSCARMQAFGSYLYRFYHIQQMHYKIVRIESIQNYLTRLFVLPEQEIELLSKAIQES